MIGVKYKMKYQNKHWDYQKTENDCWLCALKNTLLAIDYKITTEKTLQIIKDKKLELYDNRAFFPYIAVILDELHINCKFVLDIKNKLLESINKYENNVFSCEKLDEIISEKYKNKDFCYYYYIALKYILSSSYVNIMINEPRPIYYLDKGAVIVACLYASDLYNSDIEQVLHTVTVLKKNGQIQIIDPYYKLGLNNEKNWGKYQHESFKFDWSIKIPYYIAIENN